MQQQVDSNVVDYFDVAVEIPIMNDDMMMNKNVLEIILVLVENMMMKETIVDYHHHKQCYYHCSSIDQSEKTMIIMNFSTILHPK